MNRNKLPACVFWDVLFHLETEDMTKVNGEWQVCSPELVQRQCNLDEFRTYLTDFDLRLSKVFEVLEEEMTSVDLSGLSLLTEPIPGGCENLAIFWQRFLRGLCFVSLPGLRTITMAFLVASGIALAGETWMKGIWELLALHIGDTFRLIIKSEL